MSDSSPAPTNPFEPAAGQTDKKEPEKSSPKTPVEKTAPANPFESAKTDVSPASPKKEETPPQTEPAPVETVTDKKPIEKVEEEKEPPKTEAPTPEIKEGEDELLIEQDGDVFWILQKVIWSVVKVVFIGGLIGLLIWLIWDPSDNPLGGKLSDVTEQVVDKIEEKKDIILPQKTKKDSTEKKESQEEILLEDFKRTPNTSADSAANWAKWTEKMRIFEQKGMIFEAMIWLREVKGFFDVPMIKLVSAESSHGREQQIDEIMASLRSFIYRSAELRKDITGDVMEFSGKLESSRIALESSRQNLETRIKTLSYTSETPLIKRVKDGQDVVDYTVQVELRTKVIRNMESYDKLLRSTYDNFNANRQALIEGIRVVSFPGDTLNLILTPAEWQGTGSEKK